MTKDLVFEIGVEEIPASYIAPALAQLDGSLRAGLSGARLSFESLETYATPRRLTAIARGVAARRTRCCAGARNSVVSVRAHSNRRSRRP